MSHALHWHCFSLIPRRCNVKLDSKHCRICNRCVCDFDHHCIWLNVCVARRTYKAFLILLMSLIAACSAHATCSGTASTSFLRLRHISASAGFALYRASQSWPHAWWPATPHFAVFIVAAFAILLCLLVSVALLSTQLPLHLTPCFRL